MEGDSAKILLPKIKKIDFRCKILLDPADIRSGLPKNKVPELNHNGIILKIDSQKAGTSKLNSQGSLKLNILYNAQVLAVVGRYVEVRVIDDYREEGGQWMGLLLGIPVKGTGGEGAVRGCVVVKIEGNGLVVTAVSEGGNPLWEKMLKKIELMLQESN